MIKARLRIIVLNIRTRLVPMFARPEVLGFYPVDSEEALEVFEKCVMKFSVPTTGDRD